MNQNITLDFSLFDGFPDMCFLINDKGDIRFYNKASGEKLEILNGKTDIFFDYVELCDRNETQNLFSKSLKLRKPEEIETRLFFKKNFINVKLSFVPFESHGFQERLTLVTARDISEEKKKEMDLIRFFNVAENTVNPLQITDLNGKMIYVNKAFENASGYSKDELIGKNPSILGSGKNSSKFWDKMWDTVSSGKVWVGEIENLKKNGESFFTQLLVSPILDKNGKVSGYFGVHRDLT
ncbi:MAG: PAS domain S-box protein, partial [Ignavibacteriales bacterium]|nr:PAS domain S-box protein [Ignavibacteriales bacterium]